MRAASTSSVVWAAAMAPRASASAASSCCTSSAVPLLSAIFPHQSKRAGECRPFRRLSELSLGSPHEFSKCARVEDRQIRKCLTVHLDSGKLQPIHKSRIVEVAVVLTHRCVDARDPEPAELPLALLAVPVRVNPTALYGILGNAPELRAAAEVTARRAEILLLLCMTRYCTCCACHISLLPAAFASHARNHPAPQSSRRADAASASGPSW